MSWPGRVRASHNGLEEFVAAAAEGDVEMVRRLLDSSAVVDINGCSRKGATALQVAADQGHVAVATLLLDHGAYVNTVTAGGLTALHVAVTHPERAAMIELLLERGAKTDLCTLGDGSTPLRSAVVQGCESLVRLLRRYGVAVNAPHPVDGPPLHLAIHKGDVKMVRLLLSLGALVDAKEPQDGSTALHAACANGDIAMVCVLIEHGADCNMADDRYRTPLMKACSGGHAALALLLLSYGAAPYCGEFTKPGVGFICSMAAMVCASGRVATAVVLHTAGFDLDEPECMTGAAKRGCVAMVRFLASVGVDVNATHHSSGATALHLTTQLCRLSNVLPLVSLLHALGADLDRPDAWGTAPVHDCGSGAILDYLLNEHGATPLYCACLDNNKQRAALLLRRGADATIATTVGATPTHRACADKDVKMMRLLHRLTDDARPTKRHLTTVEVPVRRRSRPLAANKEGRIPSTQSNACPVDKIVSSLRIKCRGRETARKQSMSQVLEEALQCLPSSFPRFSFFFSLVNPEIFSSLCNFRLVTSA